MFVWVYKLKRQRSAAVETSGRFNPEFSEIKSSRCLIALLSLIMWHYYNELALSVKL